jgi:hypothetical protein
MRSTKVVAAIITVIAVGGLLGWFFGFWGGHGGVDQPEYQNQRY